MAVIARARKLSKYEWIRLPSVFAARWTSQYFVTTPIFYVNAEPHIGHLYTAAVADAKVRFHKLKNPNADVKFMVGTDEHGLKVSRSAKNLGLDNKVFCDKISSRYRDLFSRYSIDAGDFVRTTEERHFHAATALWNKIAEKNLIYLDHYEGWYCESDEMFIKEHCLEQGSSADDIRYTLEGGKPVRFVSETNYKFQLGKFQDDLLYWLKGNVVKPKLFQDTLHNWIVNEDVLGDISISRPSKRVPWGIPVPGDPSQTMYVWFDALSSYLSTNGYPNMNYKWPPDVQVIGKDILKFHGIFWPAFLMAADLEPPKLILCHCHWLKDSEKISKSKGNVVDPFVEAQNYTSEGFRYFLLREGVPHSDGNFTHSKVSKILNAELANTLGNLLSRCTGNLVNENQCFPALKEGDVDRYGSEHSDNLMNALTNLPGLIISPITSYFVGPSSVCVTFGYSVLDAVEAQFEEFNFDKGIDAIISALHLTNKFFDYEAPWKMKKASTDTDKLNFILHLTMESLRVCGILLQPIIPNMARIILDKISVEETKRNFRDIRPYSWEYKTQNLSLSLNPEKVVLFSKIKAAT